MADILPFTYRRPAAPTPAPRPDSADRMRVVAVPIVGRLFGEDVELYVSDEEIARLTGLPPRD